jgi:hypothetical protein
MINSFAASSKEVHHCKTLRHWAGGRAQAVTSKTSNACVNSGITWCPLTEFPKSYTKKFIHEATPTVNITVYDDVNLSSYKVWYVTWLEYTDIRYIKSIL